MAFQKRSDFTKITGLWPSKPGSKTRYLSGQLTEDALKLLADSAKVGGRVFIFQERPRPTDKFGKPRDTSRDPSHTLVIAPPQPPRGEIAPEPDPFKEPEDFPF